MSSAHRLHPLSLPFLLPRRSRLLLRKIIFATNANVDGNNHNAAATAAVVNTIPSRRRGYRSGSSGWKSSSSAAAEPPAGSTNGGIQGNRRGRRGNSIGDLQSASSYRGSNDSSTQSTNASGSDSRSFQNTSVGKNSSRVHRHRPSYGSIKDNGGFYQGEKYSGGGYKGASHYPSGGGNRDRDTKSRYRSLKEALVPEEYKHSEMPTLNKLLRLEKLADEPPPDNFERLYKIYSKSYWMPPPPASPIQEIDPDSKTAKEKLAVSTNDDNVPYAKKERDKHSPPFRIQEPKAGLSENEVKKHFLHQIDHFLPPSLRKETSRPSPSFAQSDDSIYPRIHLSTLDVPWPSLVRTQDEEQTEFNDPTLQAADEEFEAKLNSGLLLNMLKVIQAAALRNVDILCELLQSRRERAVYWIVRKLVDPASDQPFFAAIDIWKGSAAYESTFASSGVSRSNNPALDVMVTPFFPSGVKELNRRRVGMGYVLRSVASMLHAGFLKEQEQAALQAKKSQERAYRSAFEARTSEEDKEFLDLLKPRSVAPEVEPLSLDEISSCAVLILAYLHSHDHVPAKVYSPQKHVVLHELHHKIIRKMMEAAESSYLYDLGFKPPKAKEEDGFDWACWVELVLTIATERGLSGAAGDIITKLNSIISFVPDDVCLSRRQTAEWNAYPFLKGIWHGATAKSKKENKKSTMVISRSVALQAFDGLISNGVYDGDDQDKRTLRTIKYMNLISKKIAGIDGAMAARVLQSPTLDLRSASAIHLLDVSVRGVWPLPLFYELLLGAISRVNTEDVIRCWRRMEALLIRQGLSESHPLMGRRYTRVIRPMTTVADEGVFKHSPHILSALLHYLRSHTLDSSPHMIRHIIVTAVTPEHLKYPAIFNPLISYAAVMNESEFLTYMLDQVPEPVDGPTLSTLINFSLRIDKPDLAKVFLQRKRDLGLKMEDGFEFGILVENAFRRSFDEGLRLMYRAIRDIYASEGAEVPSSIHRRFAFSNTVQVEREPLSRTPLAIGDVAWQSLLNAAVDHRRYDLIILALSGLGLDLSDPKVASKMGTVLFTKLLDAIVDVNGSTTGMRIFQRYCIPPRATSATSVTMTDKDDDRSVIGILETADITARANKLFLTPRRTGRMGVDEEVISVKSLENFAAVATKQAKPIRSSGLVTPNRITIATIVHRALKERDMVFYSRQILEKDAMERSKEEDSVLMEVWKLEKQEGGMNGWNHVLTWAKKVWKELGYNELAWKGLDRTKGVVGGKTVQRVPEGVVMKSLELKKGEKEERKEQEKKSRRIEESRITRL